MWRDWLGPDARIIGIDMNPAAEQWRDHGFEIIIGDQGDPLFWDQAMATIGPFDVLLDDGGHQSFQQIVTATAAIAGATQPCLVVVEDTGTSFMRDFSRHGRHSFLKFAKDLSDLLLAPLVAGQYRDRFPRDLNAVAAAKYRNVTSVEFHCGVVVFHCDPGARIQASVVRNRDASNAVDFRYEGVESAQVDWPSLFGASKVVVRGGDSGFSRVREGKAQLREIAGHAKRGDLRAALRKGAALTRKALAFLATRW